MDFVEHSSNLGSTVPYPENVTFVAFETIKFCIHDLLNLFLAHDA